MNEEFFKTLGQDAANKFLSNNEPLNESITKAAVQHKLNANQIARVCEAANLKVYLSKMGTASDRRFEFPLADQGVILEKLSMQKESKPVKTAEEKHINYFVKSAAVKDTSVFAPEYNLAPNFLSDLSKPDPRQLHVPMQKSAHERGMEEHLNKLSEQKYFWDRCKLAEKIEALKAESAVAVIKLASEIANAVALIKQSAMSSNPFLLWPEFTSGEKADVADQIFSEAASDLAKHNPKLATELLLEAKAAIPERNTSIADRNVKVILKEPIIKAIDNITNYKRIIDKIEQAKSRDGIYELSSTPTGMMVPKPGKEMPAKKYFDELIEEKDT